MAQILVRDLDPELVARLKERAKRNHRSLQGEIKAILERTAAPRRPPLEMRGILEAWQRRLAGREFSDSVAMIREDRDR